MPTSCNCCGKKTCNDCSWCENCGVLLHSDCVDAHAEEKHADQFLVLADSPLYKELSEVQKR